MAILENYKRIRSEVPEYVKIVAASKTRTAEEVKELINAGITDIGENYVQEAEETIRSLQPEIAKKVKWHFIGHLQKNKINKALSIFDFIQTVDSFHLARAIDNRVEKAGKAFIPILLEINIGSESTKYGINPEDYKDFENDMVRLVEDISKLSHIHLEGVMTMGPLVGDPEKARPFFRRAKKIYDTLSSLNLSRVNMRYLSMGMTNSYKVAISEGSNLIRIGTAIFGLRKCDLGDH